MDEIYDDALSQIGPNDETDDDYQAKFQAAAAYIIAREKCPICFGDLSPGDHPVIEYYECDDCGRQWNCYGLELDRKISDTLTSEIIGTMPEENREIEIIGQMFRDKYKP